MTINVKVPQDGENEKESFGYGDPREEPQADPFLDDTGEYREPSMLDIPDFPDKDQYVYRWLRVTVRGEDDYNNISRRTREGWTFVKQEDLPKGYFFPTISEASSPVFDGCVRNGDLVLGKLPRKKAEGYLRNVHKRAADMLRAVSNRTLRDGDTGAVAQNDGHSFVTKGNQAFDD